MSNVVPIKTPNKLGNYDGQPVVGIRMSLSNVGHGLDEAIDLGDAPALKMGDRGMVLVEFVVAKHEHAPHTKDDYAGPRDLVLKLKGEYAMIMTHDDNKTVTNLMNKHKSRVHKLREEIEGQEQLDVDPKDEDE